MHDHCVDPCSKAEPDLNVRPVTQPLKLDFSQEEDDTVSFSSGSWLGCSEALW